MNSSLVAKNVLIHKQIEEICDECEKQEIKLVLLKGAALIELFPEYSFYRDMEDIDVMVNKKDYDKFVKLLKNLGYKNVPSDPNTLYSEDKPVKIDIFTELWYLSKKENFVLFNNLQKVGKFYVLPPEEMLRHICYHMYIEHNYIEEKWLKDIEIIKSKFCVEINFESFIPKWIRIWVNKKIFYKGHLLEFFVLPLDKKIQFLIKKLFPSSKFLLKRYNLRNKFFLPIVYFYRFYSLLLRTIYVFYQLMFIKN